MTECAWCARPPPNGDTSRCCSEVSISDARLWAAATGALRRRAHIQPSTLSRIGPSPTEPPEKLRWPRNVTVGCSQTARSSPLRRYQCHAKLRWFCIESVTHLPTFWRTGSTTQSHPA
jgi:hypothetical protein